MPLHYVAPNVVPQIWGTVAPMLQRAIDIDPSAITIEQVEYFLRTGRSYLLVWEEPEQGITGACTVDLIDYPTQRVGHINLLGGKGVVNRHVFEEVKAWMRNMGAKTAQCWAKGSHVVMYEKMGMENTHQVMRVKL